MPNETPDPASRPFDFRAGAAYELILRETSLIYLDMLQAGLRRSPNLDEFLNSSAFRRATQHLPQLPAEWCGAGYQRGPRWTTQEYKRRHRQKTLASGSSRPSRRSAVGPLRLLGRFLVLTPEIQGRRSGPRNASTRLFRPRRLWLLQQPRTNLCRPCRLVACIAYLR